MISPAKKAGGAPANKKKWIAVAAVAGLALAGAALFVLLQPDEELDNTLKALNGYGEIQEHGGHVETVTWMQGRGRGGGQGFQADVLGSDGSLIGKVRGYRVEGFGTTVRQSRWKDKGDDLSAEWPQNFRRNRDRNPGEGRRQRPPDQQ